MEQSAFYNFLSGNHRKGLLHLATVSGVASTKPELIHYFDKEVPQIEIVTTKSFQVTVNPGNREPIICEPEVGNWGNSVGLRNAGMEAVFPPLQALSRKGMRVFLNVSVSADNPKDFITLVKKFDPIADSIELNFSCPHASKGFGASIGSDCAIASSYVQAIRHAVPNQKSLLLVKLTPNVDDIGSIAKGVMAAGADGLVAINTTTPLVHMSEASGTPILQNALGGKGGCSGSWVKDRALECVREIREAVGEDVPIIGMGGVASGADCRALMAAGADAIGIGSAFGQVNQKFWPEYLQAVKDEFKKEVNVIPSASFLSDTPQMAYEKMPITSITYHGKDTLTLTLEGKMSCKPGEFAFLWLPGVGEKPFSLAEDNPVTFIIKRRGIFTKALWNLHVGDNLYVRGMYGAPLVNKKTKTALLIAGGTGVAVLPSLCKRLKSEETDMHILVGTSESGSGKALLEDVLSQYGSFSCLADDGVPGRVLSLIDKETFDEDTAIYLVGPEIFMAIASKKLLLAGASSKNIYLSMERSTRCGVGICGECAVGGRLTCQWGTFMEYAYIAQEMPEILQIGR